MGCFSEWLVKILNRRSAKPILFDTCCIFECGAWRKRRAIVEKYVQSCKQWHLTFSTSLVACLKNISSITLDYPSAVKSGHCLTEEGAARREAVADESQALQKNATRITEKKRKGKCGLVAGKRSHLTSIYFCQGKHFTVRSTMQRKTRFARG